MVSKFGEAGGGLSSSKTPQDAKKHFLQETTVLSNASQQASGLTFSITVQEND